MNIVQRKRMDDALTLVEMLVVVAILLLLLLIAMPVMFRARTKSYETTEISALRQLGLAASLYSDQHGDLPYSVQPLVAHGMVPKEICASHLDPTTDGIANEFCRHSPSYYGFIAPYKSSYLGLREYGLFNLPFQKELIEDLKGHDRFGWLISLTSSKPEVPGEMAGQFKGKYMRLTSDGSVIRRDHASTWSVMPDGRTAGSPFFMFSDPPESWKKDFLSR